MKYLLILLLLSLSSSITVIDANSEPIDFDKVEIKSFLETLYVKLNDKIIELTAELSSTQSQMKQLENKVNEQSLSIGQLKAELSTTKEEMKSLKSQNNILQNDLKELKGKNET